MADDQEPAPATGRLDLVAGIIGSYVFHNPVQATDLPKLIGEIHAALQRTSAGAPEASPGLREPPVPVRRSVQADHIVCLECGRRFKSLKRHLRTDHDMKPQEYRARWGLKSDYPMVAPNHAVSRSGRAKQVGLSRSRSNTEEREHLALQYRNLIDKKYLDGLSEEENDRLVQISRRLDSFEAEFYKPIILKVRHVPRPRSRKDRKARRSSLNRHASRKANTRSSAR